MKRMKDLNTTTQNLEVTMNENKTIAKHVYDFTICISNIEERDKLREYLKLAENYELSRHEILKPNDHRLFTTIQQSEKGE
jgi:hypothetical protein